MPLRLEHHLAGGVLRRRPGLLGVLFGRGAGLLRVVFRRGTEGGGLLLGLIAQRLGLGGSLVAQPLGLGCRGPGDPGPVPLRAGEYLFGLLARLLSPAPHPRHLGSHGFPVLGQFPALQGVQLGDLGLTFPPDPLRPLLGFVDEALHLLASTVDDLFRLGPDRVRLFLGEGEDLLGPGTEVAEGHLVRDAGLAA